MGSFHEARSSVHSGPLAAGPQAEKGEADRRLCGPLHGDRGAVCPPGLTATHRGEHSEPVSAHAASDVPVSAYFAK